MRLGAVALTLGVLALAVLCAGCGAKKVVEIHGNPAPQIAAPAFSLHDSSGRSISLAAERGHYVILTFLYTKCPDVCPIIAGNLNRVLKSPVARQAGVRVLAVSVDPTGDTAAAVRMYVRERSLVSAFYYLIGTPAQLQRVWAAYKLAPYPGKKGSVTHSTFEMLIDPSGTERLIYDATAKPEEIVADLTQLTKSS